MGSNSPLKKSDFGSLGATAGLSSSVSPGVSPRTAGQASSGTLFQRAKFGLACAVCAVAVAIGGGCGSDGLERAVVAGRVTYQGQPVAKGKIRFVPIKDTKTPMWGAFIRDGRYKARGKGGVPVGTHRVEIVAWRTRPDAAETTNPPTSDQFLGGVPVGQQYLPDKYNTKTELEITIPPGSGRIIRDFDLTE